MNKIVRNLEVVPNIHLLELEAPGIADKIKPGQFVVVMVDATGERVPFTVSDWNPEKGTITIFFLELGISTMKLAGLKPEDSVHSVVGPLGKEAHIENLGTVALGGGCYGIGALYPLAKAYKNAGNKVITVIEARSKYLLYLEDELKKVSDLVLVSTEDGTKGNKGKVQEVIEELLRKGEHLDLAYFIGCTFMMMSCSNATREHNIKTLVALNPIMVDGTGMCGCCRVSVEGKTKFACVDGPEFDGHQVDWQELFQRKAVYHPEEALAYQYHARKALEPISDSEDG